MTQAEFLIHPSKVDQLFEDFNKLRIMIVGDVMIDSYIFGKVDRISPEAPVPVVVVRERSNRMGGAANVALNINALGAQPVLVSVVGNDLKGNEFMQLLDHFEMPKNGVVVSDERITTTKFRIIGNNVQMLRVDEEVTNDISGDLEKMLLNQISYIIENEIIDAIVLQDYDKGVLTPIIIESVIKIANDRKIPVAVDPKKQHFLSYSNVQLFKPNLKELKDGLNITFDPALISDVEKATEKLQQKLNCQMVLTTLSEKGVLIREKKDDNSSKSTHINAHLRTIADVSGAGDTVISVATLCLALKQEAKLIAALSNIAGGLVCEEIGVVPVDKNKLRIELLKLI